MWDSVVDVVICLNRPKAGFHDICRYTKMLIISINLLGQNYQYLITSAYLLLCLWCIREYQPLVNTAANHLDTACTSLLDMCKRCQAETVKIGEGILALNWEIVVLKDQELSKMIVINTIASICRENMLAYLSEDVIYSDKQTVFREL